MRNDSGDIRFSMSTKDGNEPRLEPLQFLKRVGGQARPRYEFAAGTPEEWERWRDGLRSALAAVLGLGLMERSPLRVWPGPVDKLDGYTRHAFTIETAPGLFAPAFLLVPDGPALPRPGILCCHGHWEGMNDLVALDPEGGPRREGEGYQHDFALQAVRAGFVALVWDQFGFGRRRDDAFNQRHNLASGCEHPSKVALHFGLTTAGIRVWDAMRMIDFLQGRPEALPDRIGIVGISGGGLVAQFTAALDERIKAACVSGYCNRYESCILNIHHCIDNFVPGLGRLANNDDIACLIAPRPLLIESGLEDHIFPIEATQTALGKLERCYELLGAGTALEADLFEGGHEFHGVRTWEFFAKHLEK